jgi:hypothetical protein
MTPVQKKRLQKKLDEAFKNDTSHTEGLSQ